MTKYRTYSPAYGSPSIEKTEIVHETEKCVFLPSRWGGGKPDRKPKADSYWHYFDTFQEAKRWLIAKSKAALENAILQKEGLPDHFREMTIAADKDVKKSQDSLEKIKQITVE